MASAQNESTDTLWLLSGDLFPFQNMLMEGQSLLSVDGRVWALEELPHKGQLSKLYSDSFGSTYAPSVVIQHAQPARTFVMISAQGTHIVSKLRPVDHLRQLFIENNGPDAEAIKAFFQLHGEVQACATCLILATMPNVTQTQIADWALRAFFKYGGEPRLVFPTAASSGPRGQFSSPFHPNVASTPGPPHIQNIYSGSANLMAPPEMHFSGRHNGLYLYLSRLLRPLWHRTLVIPGSPHDQKPLVSSVAPEEVEWIVVQLLDLRSFLEKQMSPMTSMTSTAGHPHDNAHLQEAYLRERQSLMFLQQLINQSLQVLGLWKVVCEHGFELLSRTLNSDEILAIRGMYFNGLIISQPGKEVSSKLIQALISVYLGDDARTDAISLKLREVCPNLYNQEDAMSSKAQEILIKARNQTNPREKEKMIQEAIIICKDVASKLNLDILTSHLVAVHAYIGVLDVVLAAASKKDPQGLALHFYKNGEPAEDQQGVQAYMIRTSCYKHVTAMIRQLMSTSDAAEQVEAVFSAAFKSDDELFHVEMYQWLLSEKQYERLLSVRSPYLEDFLTRGKFLLSISVVYVI